MTKRDPVRNEQQNYKKLKVKTKPIILENAPPLNSLPDLVKLSQSIILYKNIDSIMLWRLSPYITELNNLIGMTSLKETIFDQILYYLQGMHLRNDSQEYLHTMIFGSPGCGKTTVAKIIGKIYQSLGILSRNGNFKIAYRDDFIAGYLGQTAIKTKKLLNSCIGGVLFIDEVYALAPRDNDKDSFSKEALDILTAFLSEHKNDFCCIGAGYEQDVEECFFGMNKGLKRRFPWVHKIDTYSSEDMAQIFGKMVKEINWNVDFNNKTIVSIIEQNKKLFTNTGGDIETLLTKCKIAHSRRVIGLDIEHKFILTEEDLENGIVLVKKHKNFEEKDTINPMYSIYI
jgi:SpoVK/Ycf46/Vps4 family AAA+-type ATPase